MDLDVTCLAFVGTTMSSFVAPTHLNHKSQSIISFRSQEQPAKLPREFHPRYRIRGAPRSTDCVRSQSCQIKTGADFKVTFLCPPTGPRIFCRVSPGCEFYSAPKETPRVPAPGPTQVWCRSRVYPGCLPSHNPGKALSRIFPGWLCGGLITTINPNDTRGGALGSARSCASAEL